MSAYNESQHPRNAAGTATGGQFAEKAHSAPEAMLEEWSEESSRTDEWLDQADDLLDEVSHIPGHPLADQRHNSSKRLNVRKGVQGFTRDTRGAAGISSVPAPPVVSRSWGVSGDSIITEYHLPGSKAAMSLNPLTRIRQASTRKANIDSACMDYLAANQADTGDHRYLMAKRIPAGRLTRYYNAACHEVGVAPFSRSDGWSDQDRALVGARMLDFAFECQEPLPLDAG